MASKTPTTKPELERDDLLPPAPRLALNIPQFCDAHDISEGMYFKLRKLGLGPREMKLGTRTLITLEAAAAWRAEREAASTLAETKAKLTPQPAPPVKSMRPDKGRDKVETALSRQRASAPKVPLRA